VEDALSRTIGGSSNRRRLGQIGRESSSHVVTFSVLILKSAPYSPYARGIRVVSYMFLLQ
jgi:hypothetical protein